MTDVKQELPVNWWCHDPQGWVGFGDILALFPLLEPEQQDALAEALHPRIFEYMHQVEEQRDAAIKRADEAERQRDEYLRHAHACDEVDVEVWRLTAENEKLRANLKSALAVADTWRESAVATKGAARSTAERIAIEQREECARWLDGDDIKKTLTEIRECVAKTPLVTDAPSKPAPKPEDLCAKCGGKTDVLNHGSDRNNPGLCRACAIVRDAPPKSRCRADFPGECLNESCPEHGVNRPGQGKHLQHEAVVMANEAIRRENNQRQLRNVERVRAVLGEESAARAYADPGYDAVIEALLDHIDSVTRISRELHDAVEETSRQYVEVEERRDVMLVEALRQQREACAAEAQKWVRCCYKDARSIVEAVAATPLVAMGADQRDGDSILLRELVSALPKCIEDDCSKMATREDDYSYYCDAHDQPGTTELEWAHIVRKLEP